MATQYAIIGTISGQTGLVAKLFARNGDTVLYTSDSVTPRTNALGQYLFTFGEPAVIPAGVYRLIAFTSGGLPLASGLRTFLGTDAETATTAPEPAELDSASITAVQSGLATAAALTAVANDVTTILGRVTATVATLWGALVEMISGTTPNRRFTAKALELGPGGAGGGGSASLANQVVIIDMIDAISTAQLAAITIDAGTISSFPEQLVIGDSYTPNTGQIRISITDADGDPIEAFGSLDLSDAAVSFTAFRPNDSAILTGTAEYFSDSSGTYVLLSLPSSETIKGKAEYTYEGRLKLSWEGVGSADDEQKTYKTTPFKFVANP